MKVTANPLARHQDHLALIEGMTAATEAAISKHRQSIRQMLRDGADVTAATNAMRSRADALRHTQPSAGRSPGNRSLYPINKFCRPCLTSLPHSPRRGGAFFAQIEVSSARQANGPVA
jgi:hypothetical protein